MPLIAGSRLGPYEILIPLGAGGMGEVYKARDIRLDRIVAVKILPESLAADPQFRERFDREARTISKLDHPHICALYDVGEDRGTSFLVMQYLEGETLEARLTNGPVLIEQSLQIAAQIAEALSTAHRSGIVHRDLKPGNVMLTKTGAKLLDFGLAKIATPAISTSAVSMLPTTPPNLTAQGAILGTFQYMAPEQIEGIEADARSDIFAFGVVLYEMLTGRHAFQGKTRAQLLGAILKDEPAPLSTILASDARAPILDRLIGDCLAKDPDDRWQTARDVRRELQRIAAASGGPVARSRDQLTRSRSSRLWPAAAILFAITTAALAAILLLTTRERQIPQPRVEFTVPPPEGTRFSGTPGSAAVPPLAVSPDGRWVTFAAKDQLWVRPMNGLAARSLPGTEGARYPFWSPDSRTIGFLTQGEVRKVEVAGGTAQKVADADNGTGASWSPDGIIVLSTLARGLFRVPSTGGAVVPVWSSIEKEIGVPRLPEFLPDGRHFLYFVRSERGDADGVFVGSLDSPDRALLMSGTRMARYASGYLLFVSGTTLMAQRFDPQSRRLSGAPIAVIDNVASTITGYAAFSVSENGVLVVATSRVRGPDRQLAWFDRSGKTVATVGEKGLYDNLQLATDGRIMFQRSDEMGLVTTWILDTVRSTEFRVTDGSNGVVSPDGQAIAVNPGSRSRSQGVRRIALASPGTPEEILSGKVVWPTDWSPDGRLILFMHPEAATKFDVSVLDLANGNVVSPFVQTPANEGQARFSADQRWVAYVSDESGQAEIYVRHFPDGGHKTVVSHGGGRQPRWDRRGRALFYLAADGSIMEVAVSLREDGINPSPPRALFRVRVPNSGDVSLLSLFGGFYAPAEDGSRFLVAELVGEDVGPRVNVILNWLSGLTPN